MRTRLTRDDLQREVIYAARALRRSRGFAIAAILTLALGIGANGAIFSVMYGVLWKPLPFPESSRLVRLDEITPASVRPDGRERRSGAITVAELLEIRARARTIDRVSVTGGLTLNTFSGQGEASRLQGYVVGPRFFETLGVAPILGRGFGAEEEQPEADRGIVLGYSAWQRHFGGDPAVIGRTLVLADALRNNAQPRRYSVVGVMPQGFVFPDRQFEFWLPIAWNAKSGGGLIARLAPDATLAAAEAEIGGMLRDLRRPAAGVTYTMTPLSKSSAIDDLAPALRLLGGAALFVLLIACANVGNLLVARSIDRQREMAVRLALGAGRGRLLLHALTETTLLAMCGGLAGMLLAAGGVRLLKTLATTLGRLDLGVQLAFPRLDDIALDPIVIVFVALMSIVTGILLGVAPAIRYTRPGRMAALKQTAGGYSDSGGPRRAGNVVVAVEIALALMLLVGGGLLVRSLTNLLHINPGYNPANVLTFQVALPADRYPLAAVRTFVESFTARLETLPGVEAAAQGQLPMVVVSESAIFRRTPEFPKPVRHNVSRRLVSRDYLKALGIRVVAGRGFTEKDRAGQPRVLLINETLARSEFPGENPIGRTVYAGIDPHPWEIVGIVADVRQMGLDREPGMQVFAEYSQWPGEVIFPLGPYFSVRTHSDPMRIVATVREVARQIEPEAGLFNVATMEQIVNNRISRPRMYTVLVGIFAVIALMLAAIGVYGVMAYSVTRRTREIGIRIALGAQRSAVIALVMRQGLLWNFIGLAAGLAGAAALTRYLESLLFGVRPLDPRTFVIVSLVLLAVATLATALPARLATRVSPLSALRAE